ncbi:ATP-binding protein [Bacteroides sp. GD17]|uniref:ATP-binding protein n=1 Tax=Bacteroides sp. GD17 TaxID=3139826 RepID=UPI0025EDF644|nr:ATP-binding protein [uncultured Bacteroides sp.]
MNLISRKLETEIRRLIEFYPVITITGPRQSGKTTLCREMFPEYAYTNLEDPITRSQVIADPRKFFDLYPNGLIIDEAHHYPDLFSFIQVTVDQDPKRRFIITGSSNFALLEKVTQSLAGRTAVLTLLPLSLHELGDRINNLSTDTLMLNGCYPAIWSKNFPREDLYKNYYSTYIERDLRQIINLKDISLFQIFIRLCAGRIGTEFNASALSGEVGVTVNSIKSWLSVLQASYIAYSLPPYFENIGKRLVKSPKLYFYDTGLVCYLLGIENEQQLAVHPLRGAIFENMVVNEAIKNRLNKAKDPNLYFYRDKSQKEVDLLHLKGNQIQAYEIKSSQSYQKEYYKGIDYLKGILNDRLVKSALIYDGKDEMDSDENGAYNFRHFYLKE